MELVCILNENLSVYTKSHKLQLPTANHFSTADEQPSHLANFQVVIAPQIMKKHGGGGNLFVGLPGWKKISFTFSDRICDPRKLHNKVHNLS